ncbi:MAG TPA: hypothetical protein PKI99_08285 [Terrimesophilobacter sp.]|nr:hypothetical protein [Terrimesophilobacter sp.]
MDSIGGEAVAGWHNVRVRHPKPLATTLVGRAFSTAQASEAGTTRSRTRSKDLISPYRGVRMPANDDPSIPQLCGAHATQMQPEQFFSHVTAAMIHGLPLPWQLQNDKRIHVGVVGDIGPIRMRGVIAHRLEKATVESVDGLRVLSPTETWRYLSTAVGFTNLVSIGDALVRRMQPLATMRELGDAVRAHRGHRGARLLRQAFASVRPGVDSPMETRIRLIILEAGLPEPVVNARILNRYGAFIALGDMVYPDYRVLVEYDGEHHFGSVEQSHHDIDRLDEVMEEKWRVIRLNSSHLRRKATVIHKVRTALEQAGWRH